MDDKNKESLTKLHDRGKLSVGKKAAILLSVRLADIPRSGFTGSINAIAIVYSRRIERGAPDCRRCWVVGDRFVGKKKDLWTLVGHTELIRRRSNPVFADTFKIECSHRSIQDVSIRVEVYNAVRSFRLNHKWYSNEEISTRRSIFVGACEVDLIDLIKASERGGEAKVALHNVLSLGGREREVNSKNGYAILAADSVMICDSRQYELQMTMKRVCPRNAQQALKVHRFHPFLQIFRKRPGGSDTWALIYRSETLYQAKNVERFQPVVVPMEVLVGADPKGPFRIEICHNRGEKRYRLLGWVDLTPELITNTSEGHVVQSVVGASVQGRKYDFEAKVIAEACDSNRSNSSWCVPLVFTIAATPSYNLIPIRAIDWQQAKRFKLDPTKEAKSWQLQARLEDAGDALL